MVSIRKPVKWGEDFVRGSSWEPKIVTEKGAQRIGNAQNDLARYGFVVVVVDCGEYWRINICK